MSIQGWFPLRLTGLISLLLKGLSRVFSSTTIWKHQFFGTQPSLWSNSHIVHNYWKNHSFDYGGKLISLVFNMLSTCDIAFLPRSKYLNFMATITVHSNFGAQENKICHCFQFFPIYLSEGGTTRCQDLCFLNVEFQNSFFTLLFQPHQEALYFLFTFCH